MRILALVILLLSYCASAAAAKLSAHEAVLDLQMIAYNNHDVAAYAKNFHDDIVVYNYPREVLTTSKGGLIESIAKTFKERKPHAGIISKIIINDKIITHEKAVFSIKSGRRTIPIVKIYQFEDGLIRRMTIMN